MNVSLIWKPRCKRVAITIPERDIPKWIEQANKAAMNAVGNEKSVAEVVKEVRSLMDKDPEFQKMSKEDQNRSLLEVVRDRVGINVVELPAK